MTPIPPAIDHDLLVFVCRAADKLPDDERAAVGAWTAEAGPTGIRLSFFDAGLTPLKVLGAHLRFAPAPMCEVHDVEPDLLCRAPSVIHRRAHEDVVSPAS